MAEKVDGCCLSALGERFHEEAVVISDLQVHIGLSMSSFPLILTKNYGYIQFSETPIDFAIVGEGFKVQNEYLLPLPEEVNHTSVKSFCAVVYIVESVSHVVTKSYGSKVCGRHLSRHRFSCRRGI